MQNDSPVTKNNFIEVKGINGGAIHIRSAAILTVWLGMFRPPRIGRSVSCTVIRLSTGGVIYTKDSVESILERL